MARPPKTPTRPRGPIPIDAATRAKLDALLASADPPRPRDRPPATTANDPVLAEIVRRLVARFKPQRVYLFGSRARGDWTDDSDYDLLVVVGRSKLTRFDRAVVACRDMIGVPASADVLVLTRSEYDKLGQRVYSIARTVSEEGVVVHAA